MWLVGLPLWKVYFGESAACWISFFSPLFFFFLLSIKCGMQQRRRPFIWSCVYLCVCVSLSLLSLLIFYLFIYFTSTHAKIFERWGDKIPPSSLPPPPRQPRQDLIPVWFILRRPSCRFFISISVWCRDLRAKRRGREYRPKKNESLAKSEIFTHLLSRNVFCKCVCVCVYSRKAWKTSGLLFAVCSQLSFIRMWLVPARATEAPAEDVARFQRAHSDRGLLLWAASGRIRCHSLLQCRVFKHWITEVLAPGLEWCLTKRRLEIKENLNLMNMH